MFQDAIFYANEEESLFFKLSDLKPLIEEKVGLPVRIIQVGERQERLEDFLQEYHDEYGEEPTASWWALAYYEDPGGIKDGMFKCCLFPTKGLIIASYEPPAFLRMNTENRLKAVENVSPLTFEYIRALEQACRQGWQLYKETFDTEAAHAAQQFRKDYFRIGYLLPDENSDSDYHKKIQSL